MLALLVSRRFPNTLTAVTSLAPYLLRNSRLSHMSFLLFHFQGLCVTNFTLSLTVSISENGASILVARLLSPTELCPSPPSCLFFRDRPWWIFSGLLHFQHLCSQAVFTSPLAEPPAFPPGPPQAASLLSFFLHTHHDVLGLCIWFPAIRLIPTPIYSACCSSWDLENADLTMSFPCLKYFSDCLKHFFFTCFLFFW